MMLRAPGMMIGAIIMATQINASLAVIIGVTAPILAVTIFFIMKTAFPRFMTMQKKIDTLNTGIQENLTNVRVIKSFVREEFEEERFCQKTEDLRDKSLRALKMVVMTMPIMTLAMNITTLAVVWFGGQQVMAGDMLIGDLSAFTTYVVQILSSLMMVAMIILQSSRAMASSKRSAATQTSAPEAAIPNSPVYSFPCTGLTDGCTKACNPASFNRPTSIFPSTSLATWVNFAKSAIRIFPFHVLSLNKHNLYPANNFFHHTTNHFSMPRAILFSVLCAILFSIWLMIDRIAKPPYTDKCYY